MAKAWYKSKTIWWNALSVVAVLLTMPEIVAVMPQEWIAPMAAISAVGNLILRFVTNTGLKA